MNLEKLRNQLIEFEGIRFRPYRCTAGKLTIGVGRNLDDVGISVEEAYFLLDNDIKAVVASLNKYPFFTALEGDDVRQRVLVDMAFNLGVRGLLEFRQTLAAVEAKDFGLAARLMLASKWAGQVGRRARILSEMMRSGLDKVK